MSQSTLEISPLSQRLSVAGQDSDGRYVVLTENVPTWPTPPLDTTPFDLGDGCYAPSQGLGELLASLRARECARGVDVPTESILITNGAFDGIGLTSRFLRHRGVTRVYCCGRVLHSLAALFEIVGLQLTVGGWPNPEDRHEFVRDLGPEDALYLNTPHNPTGARLAHSTVSALLRAKQRQGFSILFDLVYDSFVPDDSVLTHPLALLDDWQDVYAVNSFSKNYGAPGMRVGWLLATPAVIRHLAAILEAERICVATGAQMRAAQLLARGNGPLRARVATGRRLVTDWSATHDFACVPADAGTQAWVDVGCDADEFADRLMADAGVVVTTGSNYVPRASGHIRIPLGISECELRAALEKIAATRQLVGVGRVRT